MNFGPYQIVRRLAVGGMSEVFLARHIGIEGLERQVVIKRIRQGLSNDEEFRTMFLDEARLMAALSHPNIAQVFDLGQMEGSYHLVMEYVRGPTLNTLLHATSKHGHKSFPLSIALGIGLGIAEALAYVHSRRDELGRPLRIVHRDLKPANIIVSYDGAVKLIDFGIAKAASKVYETRTGVIKGTYGYIAPEQLARGASVDHRVDVFAMGVILYEMCVGAHPFDISDEPNLLERILNARYVRPRKASPEIPKSLDKLIASCLAPHPEGRPEDMNALVKLITEEQLLLGHCASMAAIGNLVRNLVQDTEGHAPVKSLVSISPAPLDPVFSGPLEGTATTSAEGMVALIEETEAEESTQRISANNMQVLRELPRVTHENSASSWEEAQTMVASEASEFTEGETALVEDVDWAASVPKAQSQGSGSKLSMSLALLLAMLLLTIGGWVLLNPPSRLTPPDKNANPPATLTGSMLKELDKAPPSAPSASSASDSHTAKERDDTEEIDPPIQDVAVSTTPGHVKESRHSSSSSKRRTRKRR